MFCYTNLKRTGDHTRGNQTEINKNSFFVKQILIGKKWKCGKRTIKGKRTLLDKEKLRGVAIKIIEKIYELRMKKFTANSNSE